MAREIVTHSWCDPCLADDVREPGEPVQVTLGVGAPRVVELCETHRKSLLEPLNEVLGEYGRRPDTTAAKSSSTSSKLGRPKALPEGPFPCLVPGCRSTMEYRSRSLLGAHTRHQHGMTIRDYLASYGAESQVEIRRAPKPRDDDPPHPQETDEPQLELEPTTELVAERSGDTQTCEVCGKVYSYPTNKRPSQALGIHRSRSHGIRSPRRAEAS